MYQQQKHHMSRFDSYNTDSGANNAKYTNLNPTNNNSNNPLNINSSSIAVADQQQNINSNNNNSSNNSNNNNITDSSFNKIDKNTKQTAPIKNSDHQSEHNEQSSNRNHSRSRSSSDTNLSPRNSIKKLKISEELKPNPKLKDDEDWDESPSKQSILIDSVKTEEKVLINENSTSSLESINNRPGSSSIESTIKSEETSSNEIKKQIETPNEQVPKTVEETKENQSQKMPAPIQNIPVLNGPVLSSTAEDINKYYKPELASRLTSCLGVVEVRI